MLHRVARRLATSPASARSRDAVETLPLPYKDIPYYIRKSLTIKRKSLTIEGI